MTETIRPDEHEAVPATGARTGRPRTEPSADGADWGQIRSAVAAVAHWAPAVLLAGVVVAGAVWFLGDSAADEPTAVTTVGLTEEVVWPFFDVVRESAFATADSDEVRRAVAAEVGSSFVDYRVERPDGLLLLDLVVVATAPDAATEGSRFAAETVVAREIGDELVRIDTEVEAARSELAATRRTIEETDTAIATQSDVAQAAQGDAEQTIGNAELAALRSSRIRLRQDAIDLENEIARLEARREVAAPAIEAFGTSLTDGSRSAAAVALAAGLAAALVAAGVAVAVARDRGRIRSLAQAQAAFDLPIVDAGPAGPQASVARLLRRARDDGHLVVAVDAAPGAESIGALEAPSDVDGAVLVAIDDASGRGSAATAAVIVAARHRSTMSTLRRRVDQRRAEGLEVRAVVLR